MKEKSDGNFPPAPVLSKASMNSKISGAAVSAHSTDSPHVEESDRKLNLSYPQSQGRQWVGGVRLTKEINKA
jgi:hypothetical protein